MPTKQAQVIREVAQLLNFYLEEKLANNLITAWLTLKNNRHSIENAIHEHQSIDTFSRSIRKVHHLTANNSLSKLKKIRTKTVGNQFQEKQGVIAPSEMSSEYGQHIKIKQAISDEDQEDDGFEDLILRKLDILEENVREIKRIRDTSRKKGSTERRKPSLPLTSTNRSHNKRKSTSRHSRQLSNELRKNLLSTQMDSQLYEHPQSRRHPYQPLRKKIYFDQDIQLFDSFGEPRKNNMMNHPPLPHYYGSHRFHHHRYPHIEQIESHMTKQYAEDSHSGSADDEYDTPRMGEEEEILREEECQLQQQYTLQSHQIDDQIYQKYENGIEIPALKGLKNLHRKELKKSSSYKVRTDRKTDRSQSKNDNDMTIPGYFHCHCSQEFHPQKQSRVSHSRGSCYGATSPPIQQPFSCPVFVPGLGYCYPAASMVPPPQPFCPPHPAHEQRGSHGYNRSSHGMMGYYQHNDFY